jgi:hypothetical protein
LTDLHAKADGTPYKTGRIAQGNNNTSNWPFAETNIFECEVTTAEEHNASNFSFEE